MGSIYRRTKKDPATGRNVETGPYWVKYHINGRPIRESARTTKASEAKRFLIDREERAAQGAPVLPRTDRVAYDELAHDLRLHYATTGERDLKEADTRFKALHLFFTGRRATSLKEGWRRSTSNPA